MRAIASISVEPLGGGTSLSKYIKIAETVLADYGLCPHVHAANTSVEGELSELLPAIERCHELIHEEGVPRIVSHIRIETRVDRVQERSDQVRRITGAPKGCTGRNVEAGPTKEQRLDSALADTFPASDPVSMYR